MYYYVQCFKIMVLLIFIFLLELTNFHLHNLGIFVVSVLDHRFNFHCGPRKIIWVFLTLPCKTMENQLTLYLQYILCCLWQVLNCTYMEQKLYMCTHMHACTHTCIHTAGIQGGTDQSGLMTKKEEF